MNAHIPDSEPPAPMGWRRYLPGPHSEQGCIDEEWTAAEMDDYDRERIAREVDRENAAAAARAAAEDEWDAEHGMSESLRRWEDDRMAGLE